MVYSTNPSLKWGQPSNKDTWTAFRENCSALNDIKISLTDSECGLNRLK